MDKRTISINPKLFEITSGKRKSERRKPNAPPKSGTLKKELFKRIKHHKRERDIKQKELEKKANNPDNASKQNENEDEPTMSDFSSAMKDLTDIVNNRKKTMKKEFRDNNGPRGLPPVIQPNTVHAPPRPISPVIHLNLPASLDGQKTNTITQPNVVMQTAQCPSFPVNRNPPYGCLKGGIKPTYKTWKNHHKGHSDERPSKLTIVDTNPMGVTAEPKPMTYRQKRLEEIKRKLKIENDKHLQEDTKKEPKLSKKTIKNTYALGKKGKAIKVLIKNTQTRKNDQIKKNIIEKTEAKDMKLYLKNQGLITAGSTAPPDVIRELYASSKLTGDIENKNSDNLIENYLATDS